ncbi:sugar ABC transporter permease [Diplocloster hominis]|uniref:carbohydrate ABC transporter permease n=1 Tax=Diplocloster hominis TaxID=3079010 RepID=UPI0031BA426B
MDKKLKKFYPNYFTIPAVVLFVIFFAVPVAAAFALSFTDWNINRLFTPKFNGIDNFVYLVQDEYFLLALKNTFKFAIISTVLIIVIGLLLALLLNQKLFGKSFYRTLFYLPAVLSLIVVGIMFTAVLRMGDGVLNQLLGALGLESLQRDWLGNPKTALNCVIFVQIWKWAGFAMAIFLAGLQGIPKDFYEAATIDGAGKWQQFRNITFPLLAPAFTVVVTMNTIGGFKVFEQVYVMTGGGPGNASQVLGTYIYREFSKGSLGRSTAMGLILFLMITVIALLINGLLKRREVEM